MTTFLYWQSCGYNGIIEFEVPNTESNITDTSCRSTKTCSTSPTPSEDSNLEIVALADGITLQEHEIQEYACKAGKTLKGIKHEFINDENKVELPCITGTYLLIKFRPSVVAKKCRHFLNPRRKYFHNFKCGAEKKWGNLKTTKKNEQIHPPSIFYLANSWETVIWFIFWKIGPNWKYLMRLHYTLQRLFHLHEVWSLFYVQKA